MARREGFTLIELLVVTAVMGIAVIYMFETITAGNRAYTVLDQVAETQQSMRAVADLLERDIRHAGMMVPQGAAVCGVDNTTDPDVFYVSDAEAIDPGGDIMPYEGAQITSAGATIAGSYAGGDVTIGVELKLGDDTVAGCDFDFNYVIVSVDFPFCCAVIDASVKFGCDGFVYADFCVYDITIENLPWLTLDACITFQTGSKLVQFYPQIDLGVIGCDFDIFYRLLTDPEITGGDYFWGTSPLVGSWLLDGIIFDGIQIACEIGGVSFTGISYWGPGLYGWGYAGYGYYYPGILYGYGPLSSVPNTPFFEAYQIATTDDGCCGPFSFDVTVFFDSGSDELFDVAIEPGARANLIHHSGRCPTPRALLTRQAESRGPVVAVDLQGIPHRRFPTVVHALIGDDVNQVAFFLRNGPSSASGIAAR